jgi:hypothetical protein
MPRARRLLGRTLGLLLAIALMTPATAALQATAAHADPGSEEAQFVALTNQLRAQHGLQTLASYGPLVSIARNWSGRMAAAGGISHNMNLPNQVSGSWTKLGENVGVGGSVGAIQQAFINSPHHYENLVDPVYNYVGIGVVDSGGRIWVTVDFMQLNSAPATTAAAPAPRVSRPRPAAAPAPRPAAVPQPVPVAAAPAQSSPAPPPPAAEPATPSPALILALEQVRSADH